MWVALGAAPLTHCAPQRPAEASSPSSSPSAQPASPAAAAPALSAAPVEVSNPPLPPPVIQRVVRENYATFRGCYEAGLAKDVKLEGRVTTRFAIDRDGNVVSVSNAGSSLADASVVTCVFEQFQRLKFPKPRHPGFVTVVYPIMFAPG